MYPATSRCFEYLVRNKLSTNCLQLLLDRYTCIKNIVRERQMCNSIMVIESSAT